jgi:hypothetical protein
MTQQGKLPRKRAQAIAALLCSPTIAAAADKSGVSERTLLRWLADPDFTAEYTAAKQALLEGAVNRLRASAMEFVTTLHAVAVDLTAPPASRATAARSGLEILVKFVTLEELERRLTELERNAALLSERRNR